MKDGIGFTDDVTRDRFPREQAKQAHDALAVSSRVSLGRTRVERRHITLRGFLTLERYERLPDGSCGRLLGSRTVENTIANKPLIMGLFLGNNNSHFSQSFSHLKVATQSGGSGVTKSFDGAAAGTPSTSPTAPDNPANGTRFRWTFNDDTDDVYVADWARLYNGDPAPANGTEDGQQAWHISETNPGFGQKPSTENWHYHYDLEIFSADTDIKTSGTTRLMVLLTGATSDHLSATTTFLQPRNSTPANVGSAITAGVMSQPTTTSVEFTFVSAAGQNTGAWVTTIVRTDGPQLTSADLRNGGCKQDGSSCGTKASDEEWTYKWRFDI